MNLVDTDPSKKTVPNKVSKTPAPAPAEAAPKSPPPPASPAPAAAKATPPQTTPSPAAPKPAATEVNAVVFQPSPIPTIPPTKYTFLDRVTPGGRRRRQLANMETGFRQILGLVQSMRENQQLLFKAFEKLPDAVDSVKKLADHSAQQAELLQAMNSQMTGGSGAPLGKFNETLASMDKTTQLLLERAQRSEERLYNMLRRAQRRITVMTLLVVLTFAGGILYVLNPEQARTWIDSLRGAPAPAAEAPAEQKPAVVVPAPAQAEIPAIPPLPEETPTPAPAVSEPEIAPPAEAPVPTALPTPAPVPEVPKTETATPPVAEPADAKPLPSTDPVPAL